MFQLPYCSGTLPRDDDRGSGKLVEQLGIGMQRDRREESAIVELQGELEIVFGGEISGRAEKRHIAHAERPDLVELEIRADEPVEFVPSTHRLAVSAGIEVVPDAGDQRDVIERRGRIVVGVQNEAVEDLRREP